MMISGSIQRLERNIGKVNNFFHLLSKKLHIHLDYIISIHQHPSHHFSKLASTIPSRLKLHQLTNITLQRKNTNTTLPTSINSSIISMLFLFTQLTFYYHHQLSFHCNQLTHHMGRVNDKKQSVIKVTFILQVEDRTDYIEDDVEVPVDSPILTYAHLFEARHKFLTQYSIMYENYMYYTTSDDQTVLIDSFFEIPVATINAQYDGCILVIIQSYAKRVKEELYGQIIILRQEIESLKERMNEFPERQELEMLRRNSVPIMKQTTSVFNKTFNEVNLDIAILFSEPLYQQKNTTIRPARQPVDFRSQIQRLKSALKTTSRSEIKIKCMRATLENLKFLIRSHKPKILHIISHGSKDGSLDFEDDSSINLGLLRIVTIDDIKENLADFINFLPEIVFVNSCYSENIGRAFFELGVKHVVIIDSADSIEDEAAQIFSEHFYRNVFKGQLIVKAFESAKKEVELKHNSHGCCCNHSAQEEHMPDCLWEEVKKQQGRQNAHKAYHVPSSLCTCQLKNYNRHKTTCKWAAMAMFKINRCFRRKNQVTGEYRFAKKSQIEQYLFKGEIMICCCIVPGKTPHSESHKFKFLSKESSNSFLFQVSLGNYYPDIIDESDHELIESQQNYPKELYGRQQKVYNLIKKLRTYHNNVFILYGISGVGRTSFAYKVAYYCIERRAFELFFYVDLYFVKNRDRFRIAFNQITKFRFDGKTIYPSAKDRKIILVFDNCDQFFLSEKNHFYQQFNALRIEMNKSKMIIIIKKETFGSFQAVKLLSEEFQLNALTPTSASQLIFFKLKNQLEINVEYSQISSLVRSKEQAKSPKVIESICQSFSGKTTPISFAEIQSKVKMIGSGENAVYDLINSNLETLKQKCPQAYEMLLFLSQFSYGLAYDDFQMFSFGDREQSSIKLPIKKNWNTHFCHLFDSNETGKSNQIIDFLMVNLLKQSSSPETMIESSPLISMKHKKSEGEENYVIQKQVPKGSSYYLDQTGKNRFVVKRFIRDYIWTKYTNDTNHHMKFLFISFMSILMENIIDYLAKEKFVHEEFISYSATSVSGAFSLKTTISSIANTSLTQSARFAKEFQNQIQSILNQNRSLQLKIKQKDPSVFITDHKQDLLNIYDHNWEHVYKYLLNQRNDSEKIYLCCLENLLLYIPSALKISRVQPSLLLHIINSSLNILGEVRLKSKPQRNIKIYFKVSLLKVQCKLQQAKPNKTQIQAIFQDVETILSQSSNLLLIKGQIQLIRQHIQYQKKFIDIYIDSLAKSDYRVLSQRINRALKQGSDTNDIRNSKKFLLLGKMLLNMFKSNNSVQHKFSSVSFSKLKTRQMEERVLEGLLNATDIFDEHNLPKLSLKAKLIMIQIHWEMYNEKSKQKTLSVNTTYKISLSEFKDMISEYDMMFQKKENKLGGFTQFDNTIKKLTRSINEKMWEGSRSTIIFMRSIPICRDFNGKSQPIVQNLVRKKHHFKVALEEVMKEKIVRKQSKETKYDGLASTPQLKHITSTREKERQRKSSTQVISVDISSRFEILTRQKLCEELASGCSIMYISTDIGVKNDQVWITFSGQFLNEEVMRVNQSFFQQFNFSSVRILILDGENTIHFIRKLYQQQNSPQILIALSQNQEITIDLDSSDKNMEEYFIRRQHKKNGAMQYAKEFIRLVKIQRISNKEQIQEIHRKSKVKCLEVYSNFDFEILSTKANNIYIQFKEGTYKDLSPGYQGNHNIKQRIIKSQCALRRWQELNIALKHIISKNKDEQPAYINVYGDRGAGKTYFLEQLGKILVERQFYNYGVYLLEGQVCAKSFEGDFEKYINDQNKRNKMPRFQQMMKSSSYENLILILDDFHLVRPKFNGALTMFIGELVKKKVNIIVGTCQPKLRDDIIAGVLPIKIPKIKDNQIKLILYNIIDFSKGYSQANLDNIRKDLKSGRLTLKELMKMDLKIQNKGVESMYSHSTNQEAIEIKKMHSVIN